MDKLLAEFADLMKKLQAANPELYKKFVEFIGKAWRELESSYGPFPFGNWIGSISPPAKKP